MYPIFTYSVSVVVGTAELLGDSTPLPLYEDKKTATTSTQAENDNGNDSGSDEGSESSDEDEEDDTVGEAGDEDLGTDPDSGSEWEEAEDYPENVISPDFSVITNDPSGLIFCTFHSPF